VVPRLNGEKLKRARKQLRKASCRTGRVTRKKGVNAKAAKVVKQNPKAGKAVAPGAKVNLTLG
jgi:beta-lactam-binding protein with PASTA domain